VGNAQPRPGAHCNGRPDTLACRAGVVEIGHALMSGDAMTYALPALTTLVALLFYLVTVINVGRARATHKIDGPAVTGNPDFERVIRVQANTVEQLVAFLPALWIFAVFGSPAWASLIGSVWIVGRIVYALGYYKAANKRGIGFGITILATSALWLGATWFVVQALLKG
jgi:glutathione S-transferase